MQITKTNPVSLKQESSVAVFELTIREQIKLQIPSQFDGLALKRLLDCKDVLEKLPNTLNEDLHPLLPYHWKNSQG